MCSSAQWEAFTKEQVFSTLLHACSSVLQPLCGHSLSKLITPWHFWLHYKFYIVATSDLHFLQFTWSCDLFHYHFLLVPSKVSIEGDCDRGLAPVMWDDRVCWGNLVILPHDQFAWGRKSPPCLQYVLLCSDSKYCHHARVKTTFEWTFSEAVVQQLGSHWSCNFKLATFLFSWNHEMNK